MTHDFYIVEYGARADGETLNTIAIQEAIDACHDAGGGRVVGGPGKFLTGSLLLKSNVELHLSAGCRLVGSTSEDDYDDLEAPGFIGENAPEGYRKGLIQAVEAENIAITGSGEINGSGLEFYNTEKFRGPFFAKPTTVRPFMVMMYKCRDVRIEGASFVDSPCWTFWLMKCERVNIHRIRVIGDQRMINNDGIDIDSCRDVTVSDCVIRTSDDCVVLRAIARAYEEPGVCENITVSNCVLDSWCQGIRIGCPSDSVIRNSAFSNLVISSLHNGITFDNPHHYLHEERGGTADIHDIVFSNVVLRCDLIPIKISIEEGIELPRLSNLSFSNFRIQSGKPCLVQGSSETAIRDVRFSDVSIETSGDDAIVCRNCEGVSLNNVTISNQAKQP